MTAIGVGDFVECVINRLAEDVLTLGAIYTVAAVAVSPPDDPHPGLALLRLVEVPPTRPGLLGFEAVRFRPVYRPDEQLLRDLLEPLPADKEPA